MEMGFRRRLRRAAILVAGTAVLLGGLAGLVLPIVPGWLLIFLGLSILSAEVALARRLLQPVRDRMDRFRTRGLK